mmetsp:Transcript_5408/g.15366  ORF Transcript_5408/g.15366 Transcript_5408/m.15366 type:complete len:80 (+) Transcript_5408:64-303(+)
MRVREEGNAHRLSLSCGQTPRQHKPKSTPSPSHIEQHFTILVERSSTVHPTWHTQRKLTQRANAREAAGTHIARLHSTV